MTADFSFDVNKFKDQLRDKSEVFGTASTNSLVNMLNYRGALPQPETDLMMASLKSKYSQHQQDLGETLELADILKKYSNQP